jgi:hypothetical protein
MKKLILSVTAVAGLSMAGQAQGIFFADGAANQSGAVDVTIGGVADTATDINLELLYSSAQTGPYSPVVTLLLSSGASPANGSLGGVYAAAGDVSALGNILDNSTQEYALPTGNYFFEVEGWTGAYSSYAAAEASATTGVFAGISSTFAATAAAQPAPPADISSMGVLALTQVPITAVPEPSTLAMTGVGVASMLLFRRKNK